MPKTSLKIAWHEPNDMPALSATYLIVIRGLYKISFNVSSVVDVLGRPGRASSLTSSWPSLNRLYHNWTCVLLIVDSQNATVNISNVLAHLLVISFFTQNLIQFLWSIFSNRKKKNQRAHQNTTKLLMCQKQTKNPKCLILSTYVTDTCSNITKKKKK